MSAEFFGLIGILANPVEQTIDENVVKSSDSLVNKKEEIKIRCPIIKTPGVYLPGNTKQVKHNKRCFGWRFPEAAEFVFRFDKVP